MSIHRIDCKFKRRQLKDDTKQREYDTLVLTKEKSKRAMEKFHEEPYQVRYQRIMKERGINNG